jgi:GNAT superfamily N-acetyltransferase
MTSTQSSDAASENPESKTYGDVLIRLMQKKDESAVCELWLAGLAQTADSLVFFMRPMASRKMKEYGDHATSEDGDVGPNGNKLMSEWGGKSDRCMLVACLQEAPDTIVGCVAVKKGMDHEKEEPKATIGSIWRMSVSKTVRRRGLGQKLMQAAEDWAKAKFACTSMGLWTANALAAKFYCDKCGFAVKEGQIQWYDPINPFPKVWTYRKDL